MKYIRCTIFIGLFFGLVSVGFTQPQQKSQAWFGFLSSTRVSNRWSVWADFHYNPESFLVLRPGLTWHSKHFQLTGGYAYVKLAWPKSEGLRRTEHRPWAQITGTSFQYHQHQLSHRLRYEARFREAAGSMDYPLTNRWRLQTLYRYSLKKVPLYLFASHEFLFNTQPLLSDQNRIGLGAGWKVKSVQLQVGYMNRYVVSSSSEGVMNHTLTLWIFLNHDFRKSSL